MRRRTTLLCAAALAASTALPTWAQSFPSKPINFVVPYAPGGTTDLVARFVGEHMA